MAPPCVYAVLGMSAAVDSAAPCLLCCNVGTLLRASASTSVRVGNGAVAPLSGTELHWGTIFTLATHVTPMACLVKACHGPCLWRTGCAVAGLLPRGQQRAGHCPSGQQLGQHNQGAIRLGTHDAAAAAAGGCGAGCTEAVRPSRCSSILAACGVQPVSFVQHNVDARCCT